MKRICNLLIVVLMFSLAVAAVGCAAKFEVSSLDVSPEVCLPGDRVTVSATLANTGGAKGDYVAGLLVNDAMEPMQTFTLEPGASQSLSFTLMKGDPGRYVVQLEELTTSFTVLEASNLKVSPSEVEVDQPVTITANLENVAEAQTTYHCCLVCQGKEVEAKDVTVAGGSTEKVSFALSQATPGVYKVELLGFSRSFTVVKPVKPAEFKVVNLDIAPNPVKVGGQTTITISVENVGEATGTYEATLLLDGEVYQTSDVTLVGGASKPVSFPVTKDSPGSYSVEVDGQETILKVIQPVRLETGTVLKRKISGKGKLEVDNQLDSDAVVVLSAAKEPDIPLLAVYIQSHDSCKTSGIKEDTYVLYIALGEAWDENSQKFLMDATYHRTKGELKWVETTRKRTMWNVSLDPAVIAVYYQPVSENEFPSLE